MNETEFRELDHTAKCATPECQRDASRSGLFYINDHFNFHPPGEFRDWYSAMAWYEPICRQCAKEALEDAQDEGHRVVTRKKLGKIRKYFSSHGGVATAPDQRWPAWLQEVAWGEIWYAGGRETSKLLDHVEDLACSTCWEEIEKDKAVGAGWTTVLEPKTWQNREVVLRRDYCKECSQPEPVVHA